MAANFFLNNTFFIKLQKNYAEKIIFKNNTLSARCRPTGPNRPTAGRSACCWPTGGPAATRRPLIRLATSRGGGRGLSAWVRPCRPTAGRSASCWPTGCGPTSRAAGRLPAALSSSSSLFLLFFFFFYLLLSLHKNATNLYT